MTNPVKTNRLAKEKSPYLLQHAQNPVDWYPWGEEAFEKARAENKMIFLSIGYSTCHWCHVMEHESFENEEIAALLNAYYVSVKVDREERPDLDHIYMTAIQALTGSGGWPMTVFLTPEGAPITGGTYFPPDDRWGRSGMKTILPRLAKTWQDEKEEMTRAATQLSGLLDQKVETLKGETLSPDLFSKAELHFSSNFDPEYGGFGRSPKFPRSHDLSFLLRIWKRTKKESVLKMIAGTLDGMAKGGICDHLAGGFHRYSTDERWLVPHFEKMLYDQAVLAVTYLEAYQALKNPVYAAMARDIFTYILRDMTDARGGFYSAEDADSEGEEGKFYVWTPREILDVLGAEKGRLFCKFYGVTETGNFEHGTSILHRYESEEEFAAAHHLETGEFKRELNLMRDLLREARSKRIAPYKDDKVLTSWNGLMISALARGAQVLQDNQYAQAASRAAGFILTELQKNGRLLRRYRQGESAIPAFQDDYAFFIAGLLDLYEAAFEVSWLEEAKRLTDEMIRLFWDEREGGFFYSAADGEKLIARPKEFYDGAVPSANSMAACLLLRLGRITGESVYETKAEKIFQANLAALNQYPAAYPQLLIAYDFALGPSSEVVLAGDRISSDFENFLRRIRDEYDPNRVLLYHPEKGGDKDRIEKLAPFIKNQTGAAGKTAVYICRNHVCRTPALTLEELERNLS